MKMKDFIKEAQHIDPSLIRAVVSQSGGWEAFEENAPDISNHGIDGGFHGWIYYTDTCAFFRRNKKLILAMAEEQARDFGQGLFEMVQGFGAFRKDPISQEALAKAIYTGKGENVDVVYNILAWYAAEEVASAYTDIHDR